MNGGASTVTPSFRRNRNFNPPFPWAPICLTHSGDYLELPPVNPCSRQYFTSSESDFRPSFMRVRTR